MTLVDTPYHARETPRGNPDPRLDFWAERVLSEIAGMDDDAMYEKLGREMRGAQAARATGRGPNQFDYDRIGRRLMEVHERVQRSREA